jgi:Fe-Mn family superoxide dismutase
MPAELPPLPYAYDALEPTIDQQTMEVHHDKHHQAYVTNLNAALEGTQFADRPIEQVLANLDAIPDDKRMAVRNNGGGHVNHTLFWEIMTPGGGELAGPLADAIDDAFGDVEQLKAQVNEAGVKRFGSGWTWLVWDGTGLAVKSTPNQDNPIMDSDDVPLLGIDVWEHAYYLKYQNRRPDYLAAWWDVLNWDEVAKRFQAAR